MPNERAWNAATTEHEAAVAEFLVRIADIPAARWQTASAAEKWSPAEEALHVALAYEVGSAAVAGSGGMRLRISPMRAAIYRWTVLPVLLRTGKFPRGAPAPREVRPAGQEARALSRENVAGRLARAAAEAVRALRDADSRQPKVTFQHAYFGPLEPLASLRLLSVHTRHHARHLAAGREQPHHEGAA